MKFCKVIFYIFLTFVGGCAAPPGSDYKQQLALDDQSASVMIKLAIPSVAYEDFWIQFEAVKSAGEKREIKDVHISASDKYEVVRRNDRNYDLIRIIVPLEAGEYRMKRLIRRDSSDVSHISTLDFPFSIVAGNFYGFGEVELNLKPNNKMQVVMLPVRLVDYEWANRQYYHLRKKSTREIIRDGESFQREINAFVVKGQNTSSDVPVMINMR